MMVIGTGKEDIVKSKACTVVSTYTTQCPSCHQTAHFDYIGIQHWPLETARAMGIAPSVALYECTHCKTSVTEYSLNKAKAPNYLKPLPATK
jgi:RNA polymerase subunit RPABC4/transcription elongation factor Spt4